MCKFNLRGLDDTSGEEKSGSRCLDCIKERGTYQRSQALNQEKNGEECESV